MPKLLIVDDELDVREFAANFFRKRGVQVALAASGEEAFEKIAADRPDLVLLDIRMEHVSGIEVLRRLRSSGDQICVAMVSGLEDDAIVAEAKALGIVAFVHKPLILEELEKVVLIQLGLRS